MNAAVDLRQRAPNHEWKMLDSGQRHPHSPAMFVVTEEDEAANRAVYEQRGEFAAAVELRQRFPGITDNAQARECARTIAWLEATAAAPGEADAEGVAVKSGRLTRTSRSLRRNSTKAMAGPS